LSFGAFIIHNINKGNKIQKLFITGFASKIVFINQQRGKKCKNYFFSFESLVVFGD